MIILVMLLIAVVAAFSVQNAAPIAVSFLFWRFDASLAIVVFLALLLGMIIGLTVSSWAGMKRAARTRREAEEGKDAQSR